MVSILLNAVFQPWYKNRFILGHHLTIDCSHFISVICPICKVHESIIRGGHGISPKCKITLSENLCVACLHAIFNRTVQCFIAPCSIKFQGKWLIAGILHPLKSITTHFKMSGFHQSPCDIYCIWLNICANISLIIFPINSQLNYLIFCWSKLSFKHLLELNI